MRIILFLALLLPTLCQGVVANARQDTSSVTLTTSFPASGAAQITGFSRITAVQVKNSASCEVEVNCSRGATAPSALSADSFYVASNGTFSTPPNVPLGTTCYYRCIGSSSSSGILTIFAYGY